MVSDVVDFQRALNGRLIGGLVFAFLLFTTKLGTGIGGALIGWILGASGYEVSTSKTAEVINAINAIATLLPGVLLFINAFVMYLYKLDRAKCVEIYRQLYG